MKRDICVDALDQSVPAERFRAVYWHVLGFAKRLPRTNCCSAGDQKPNSSPRLHPCAYASTPRVNRSSPAIPPQFSFSVQASLAHFGQLITEKDALHETDAN